MLALAIESSTSNASVAIQNDQKILHQEFSNNPKTHTEFLNVAVEKCLQSTGLSLSQIDVFACSTGPGSFTGIRVASNIVKSFSLLNKKPLFTIDSLSLLAHGAYKKDPNLDRILCLINAHKNMAYSALFEKNKILISPVSLSVDEVNAIPTVQQALGLGDAFISYKNYLNPALCVRNQNFSDFPDAAVLSSLALEALKHGKTIEWNCYKPLYIRDSEAEEVLKLKLK
jgi:tRNA threonylcarbamoyladenosine biosynthesis protein TsaB